MSPTDYRTRRSASPEGSGNAKQSWEHFHFELASSLVDDVAWDGQATQVSDLAPEARDDLLDTVIEESTLLGFWLAWWRAGGFAGLEAAGWDRATIFRRLRRFRDCFGAHPDEYESDWIQLDLHKAWKQALERRLDQAKER